MPRCSHLVSYFLPLPPPIGAPKRSKTVPFHAAKVRLIVTNEEVSGWATCWLVPLHEQLVIWIENNPNFTTTHLLWWWTLSWKRGQSKVLTIPTGAEGTVFKPYASACIIRVQTCTNSCDWIEVGITKVSSHPKVAYRCSNASSIINCKFMLQAILKATTSPSLSLAPIVKVYLDAKRVELSFIHNKIQRRRNCGKSCEDSPPNIYIYIYIL